MNLTLPTGWQTMHKWNGTLVRMLASSGLFNIVEKEPQAKPSGKRLRYWSVLELDGLKFALDTWDSNHPTESYFREGYFKPGGPLASLKAIVKIQHRPSAFWTAFTKETNIPVTGWTIMPSDKFPLGFFQWENKPHQFTASITGNTARGRRRHWAGWAFTNKDFHMAHREDMAAYLANLKECRWGLITKGWLHHDGKNRRECEYTSCGMPLALNYVPNYPFPMVPGFHFYKLEKPEDLAKLRDVDPEPFAKASRALYEAHFSAVGAAKTLVHTFRCMGVLSSYGLEREEAGARVKDPTAICVFK